MKYKMKRYGSLLLLLWFSYIVNYLNRISISSSLPEVSSALRMTNTEAGLIISLFFIFYTLMQFPAGAISDKYNPLKVVGFGCLAYSLLGGSFGFVHNSIQAYLSRSLFGVAQAFGWVPCIAAVVKLSPTKDRGKALGLFTSCLAVGPFVGGILASFILRYMSWEFTFYIPALLGLAFSLLFLYWTKGVKFERGPPIRSSITVLWKRDLWLLAVAYFSIVYVYWGSLSWMPTLLYRRGLSLEVAAFVGVAWTLPGLLSQPLGGRLADRWPRRQHYLLTASLLLQGIVFGLVAVVGIYASIILMFIMGFLVLFPFAPIFHIPGMILTSREIGASSGFLNMVAHLGAIAAPLIVGISLDFTQDFSISILSFIPVCIIGGIFAALINLKQ